MADDPTTMGGAMAMGALQSSPTDLLIAAIKTNNNSAALSLMAQFPQAVHAADTQDGATPAHWASLFGNLEILEALVAEGVALDVSIENSGMQPVHWAATQGRTEVVKFLLARGVEINALDIKRTTPLVIAAQYDHSILVFYLVKEGADIHKLDDCNDSALHWAACARRPAMWLRLALRAPAYPPPPCAAPPVASSPRRLTPSLARVCTAQTRATCTRPRSSTTSGFPRTRPTLTARRLCTWRPRATRRT